MLLRDVPKSVGDPGTCLTQGDSSLRRVHVPARGAVPDPRRRGGRGRGASGAEVIDPTPWICYQDSCPAVIGGTLSYRDTDHLTTEYAASLAGPLGDALDLFR